MSTARSTKLTIADICDLRAYEREREAFRSEIITLKARRRVSVGPLVTFLFENRDTIRFQIQEMARAERLINNDAIQTELDVYNPLIPEPGSLSATLFLELTSEAALREWLPRLVGIERAPVFRLTTQGEVRAGIDAAHAAQLTRDDLTASVHYVHFSFTPAQVEAFSAGPVTLALDHTAYPEATVLSPETVAELLEDLRG